jgi:hypothetical protein
MEFFEEEKSHEKSNKKVSTKVIQKIMEKIKKKMSAGRSLTTEIASAPYRRDDRRLPRPRPLVAEERGGRPASRRR